MFYYFKDENTQPPPPYVVWEDYFTEQQLDILQGLAVKAKDTGQTSDKIINSITSTDYRRSHVRWLRDEPETIWVRERIGSLIQRINNEYFKFNITGLDEPIQLSNYNHDVKGGYDLHLDSTSREGIGCRKLSLAMQLSHPEEYEGGHFEFLFSENPTRIVRKRGLIVIFPSNTLHRVTPVLSGSRQSLVQWVTGPFFK